MTEGNHPSTGGRAVDGFLVALVGLLVCLSSLPPLDGWWMARRSGLTYSGIPLLNAPDLPFYLHYIRQVTAGQWIFEYPLLSGVGTPVVNLFWLAVGWLGRLAGTPPLETFHLARVLLLVPLAGSARFAAGRFLGPEQECRVGVGLLLFGSGFGGLVALVKGAGARLPSDVEIAEFTAFGSAITSPHLVASWMCFLVTVPLALTALVRRSRRKAAIASAISAVWFQFHPFYAPLIWVVVGAAALWIGRGNWRAIPWQPACLVVLGGVPAVLYHAPLVLAANREWMLDSNVLPAEPISLLLVGLGGALILAPRGFSILRARERAGRPAALPAELLVLWAVIQLGASFLPLGFERRMLQGALVPVVLLAVPAIASLWQQLGGRGEWGRTIRWPLVLLTYGSGLLYFLGASLRGVHDVRPSVRYFSSDLARLLVWYEQRVPGAHVLLAPPSLATVFAGWGGATVYVGEHWTHSRTERQRSQEVDALYRDRDPGRIGRFLKSKGIDVIYVGPAERALGGAVEQVPGLRLLAQADERRLWGVP